MTLENVVFICVYITYCTYIHTYTYMSLCVLQDPADGELLGLCPDMGVSDTQRAIDVANEVLPSWSAMTAKVIHFFKLRFSSSCHSLTFHLAA